jgi:CHASE2 domain-containing sensor protein
LLVVLLVTTGKLWFERTPDGEALQYLSYDRQQRLSAQKHDRRTELPVAVVDLSALSPVTAEAGQAPVTPREPVLKLLREIAGHGALGIGLDVDYSPENGSYVTGEDPRFFHHCQQLHDKQGHPVPVFLGVHRAQSLSRSQWLGSPEWAGLAAHVVAPREDHRKLAAWMQSKGEERICGLSARLAGVLGVPGTEDCGPEKPAEAAPQPAEASHGTDPHAEATHAAAPDEAGGPGGGHAGGGHGLWPHWFAELLVEREAGEGLKAGEYLVDYSPLDQLLAERIPVTASGDLPPDLDPERLRGKLVLVGYATPDRTTDMTQLPGRRAEVPGIFAHACGVNTLVTHPLYELHHFVRLGLDLLLGAVLIGIVFGVRLYLERSGAEHSVAHRVELLTILALMIGVWIGGSTLPERFGLIWTDYVLVVLALLLHPYAGTVTETVAERVPAVGRLAYRLGVVSRKKLTSLKPVETHSPSVAALEQAGAEESHEVHASLDEPLPDWPAAGSTTRAAD